MKEIDLEEGDEDKKSMISGMGRRGDWIEISPEMGIGMPSLRIDGSVGQTWALLNLLIEFVDRLEHQRRMCLRVR